MSIFDEILAKADAVDRTVLEKFPELKAAVVELESLKPQHAELTTKYSDTDARLKGFENWARANWDYTQDKTKAQIEAEVRTAEAAQRLTELQNSQGADMTFEEIHAGLKTQGFVTRTDLEPVVTEAISKMATGFARSEQLNGLANGSLALFNEMTPLMFTHKDEFNEVLRPAEVQAYMTTNKLDNIRLAYDQMVAPRRTEAQRLAADAANTKHQEELVAAEKRGAESERQKIVMGSGGRLPTDAGGTPPVMGHLQQAFLNRAKEGTGEEVKTDSSTLGQGVVAQLGYEDLVKDRTARTVQ